MVRAQRLVDLLAAVRILVDQAVSTFRDKAQATTKLFGYTSYTIREVRVNEGSTSSPRMWNLRASAMTDASAVPVPIEGGKAQVTVTVSGAVQMLK